jgi:predicted nucleotidyltransferase
MVTPRNRASASGKARAALAGRRKTDPVTRDEESSNEKICEQMWYQASDFREVRIEMSAVMPDQELQQLAETLARWADEAPGVPAVYLFGSRVRGDHRPDSDIDVRLFLNKWEANNATALWWHAQNETDFAELKSQLPGKLSIHRETHDEVDKHIVAAKPVLVVRKVICVWTPPKP